MAEDKNKKADVSSNKAAASQNEKQSAKKTIKKVT